MKFFEISKFCEKILIAKKWQNKQAQTNHLKYSSRMCIVCVDKHKFETWNCHFSTPNILIFTEMVHFNSSWKYAFSDVTHVYLGNKSTWVTSSLLASDHLGFGRKKVPAPYHLDYSLVIPYGLKYAKKKLLWYSKQVSSHIPLDY